jgi:hypothetical protein
MCWAPTQIYITLKFVQIWCFPSVHENMNLSFWIHFARCWIDQKLFHTFIHEKYFMLCTVTACYFEVMNITQRCWSLCIVCTNSVVEVSIELDHFAWYSCCTTMPMNVRTCIYCIIKVIVYSNK